MINVSIQIDKFKRKDDTYRIRILLTSKGKQAKIALPYTFPEGYWDGTRITKAWNGKGKTEWNVVIQRHLTEIRDFIIDKNDFKHHYTPSEVRRMWFDKHKSGNLYDTYIKDIEHFEKMGNFGLARARQETLSKLHHYLHRSHHKKVISEIVALKRSKEISSYLESARLLKMNLPKSKVDKYFLQDFDRFMIESGLSPNSRSKHLRDLRAIYNKS